MDLFDNILNLYLFVVIKTFINWLKSIKYITDFREL